ncbi:antifreeze protein type IV [Gasterosteus aculeatus]|uniref:Antifreeze protein type IV n=2 Tax=Gasterosteus aculeatus TaxID=69293 RepID=A0AAQ4PMJ8_GASAC|nr:antifreeze protein type IV [Gasterosteus aculeatus aculeatus]
MNFSNIAALVLVLAVAHGTQAGSLVRRDAQSELDKITKLINDMSAGLSNATQEVVEKIKTLEMSNTAQTYMEDSRSQIQPLVDKVQAEAAKLQEQVKPFVSDMEEQIRPVMENFQTQVKPLADNFQAQVKPLADTMMKIFQQLMDRTKALPAPQ